MGIEQAMIVVDEIIDLFFETNGDERKTAHIQPWYSR